MYLLTAPTAEPVTLAEAKVGARVDAGDTALDDLITGYIQAARQMAEQITGQRYMQCTLRWEDDDWPDDEDDIIPAWRPTTVAVTYWTGSTWATLSSGDYAHYVCGHGTALAPAVGTWWPALGLAPGESPRVRVDLTVGVTDAALVPATVKTYIKACISHWINNPDAAPRGNTQPSPLFERLLDGEKLLWL